MDNIIDELERMHCIDPRVWDVIDSFLCLLEDMLNIESEFVGSRVATIRGELWRR